MVWIAWHSENARTYLLFIVGEVGAWGERICNVFGGRGGCHFCKPKWDDILVYEYAIDSDRMAIAIESL